MLFRRISLRLSVRARFLQLLLCLGLAAFPVASFAHESPEHSIEDLTAHIQQEGESVSLLLQRASHYRVTGQTELAIADLHRVLQIEKNQQGALIELSRSHYSLGRYDAAMRYIQQAIEAAKPRRPEAHLLAMRAKIFQEQNELPSALKDYNRAIGADSLKIDWYLDRSRLHELLGQRAERIAGLWQGYESTHSAVLHSEWIEALIDGGRAQQALQVIEPRLEQARLKSTWWLRRARAQLAMAAPEHKEAARQDLHSAIAEMNIRLRPSRPDIELLLDRALAHFLLQDDDAARSDFALAKNSGATPRQLERMTRLLEPENNR